MLKDIESDSISDPLGANIVKFELLPVSDEGFTSAIHLAREAQQDGMIVDRGSEYRDIEFDTNTGKNGKFKLLYGQSAT